MSRCNNHIGWFPSHRESKTSPTMGCPAQNSLGCGQGFGPPSSWLLSASDSQRRQDVQHTSHCRFWFSGIPLLHTFITFDLDCSISWMSTWDQSTYKSLLWFWNIDQGAPSCDAYDVFHVVLAVCNWWCIFTLPDSDKVDVFCAVIWLWFGKMGSYTYILYTVQWRCWHFWVLDFNHFQHSSVFLEAGLILCVSNLCFIFVHLKVFLVTHGSSWSFQILGTWILYVWESKQQNRRICIRCSSAGAHYRPDTNRYSKAQRPRKPRDLGIHLYLSREEFVLFWMHQEISGSLLDL